MDKKRFRSIVDGILIDYNEESRTYRLEARTVFKSRPASPWRIVEVPFYVTKLTRIRWPDRGGQDTEWEPTTEYRPIP